MAERYVLLLSVTGIKYFIYLGAGHFHFMAGKLFTPRHSNLSIVPETE